jgi:hypothetical protein
MPAARAASCIWARCLLLFFELLFHLLDALLLLRLVIVVLEPVAIQASRDVMNGIVDFVDLSLHASQSHFSVARIWLFHSSGDMCSADMPPEGSGAAAGFVSPSISDGVASGLRGEILVGNHLGFGSRGRGLGLLLLPILSSDIAQRLAIRNRTYQQSD